MSSLSAAESLALVGFGGVASVVHLLILGLMVAPMMIYTKALRKNGNGDGKGTNVTLLGHFPALGWTWGILYFFSTIFWGLSIWWAIRGIEGAFEVNDDQLCVFFILWLVWFLSFLVFVPIYVFWGVLSRGALIGSLIWGFVVVFGSGVATTIYAFLATSNSLGWFVAPQAFLQLVFFIILAIPLRYHIATVGRLRTAYINWRGKNKS